ncbi:hypothetical protein Hanom_Chr16g01468961 [Helianthus anomalus]
MNQTSTSNQNQANLKRGIVVVNNQTNTANTNQSGTACYAKIINHIKRVRKEEFSESDDSSGYIGSSDEESSNIGDYCSESDVKEGSDSDVDSLLMEAEELKVSRICSDQEG